MSVWGAPEKFDSYAYHALSPELKNSPSQKNIPNVGFIGFIVFSHNALPAGLAGIAIWGALEEFDSNASYVFSQSKTNKTKKNNRTIERTSFKVDSTQPGRRASSPNAGSVSKILQSTRWRNKLANGCMLIQCAKHVFNYINVIPIVREVFVREYLSHSHPLYSMGC